MSIKQPEAERLALVLVDRYGLDLEGIAGEDAEGAFVDFRLRELHPNEGFSIRVRFEWRSVRAEFIPGQWAAGLLAEMGLAGQGKRGTFTELAKALTEAGGQILLVVNGVKCEPLRSDDWPGDWKHVNLDVRRGPIVVDLENTTEVKNAVVMWGGGLLGMTASLLPLEEVDAIGEPEIRGLPEGAKMRIEVNRYERSKLNRAMCISIHGSRCAACGLDLATMYGELGDSYIHVHHLIPVSRIGEGYAPNPATDLVPLCPNCHAMVHRKDPPLSPEELRAAIAGARQQKRGT